MKKRSRIMDEIEDFKKQNGNVKYSTKELMGALHVKIDNLEKKVDSQREETNKQFNSQFKHCSNRFIRSGTFWPVISGLVFIIGGIASWCIWMFERIGK